MNANMWLVLAVGVVAHGGLMANAQTTTIAARLQTSAINDFANVFTSTVLPKMIAGIGPFFSNDDKGLFMSGLNLELFDEAKLAQALAVTVETLDTVSDAAAAATPNTARVKVTIGDTKINVAFLNKELFGFLGAKCTLRYHAETQVRGLAFVYDIAVTDNENDQARSNVRLSLASLEFSGTHVDLFYNSGSGVCGWGLFSGNLLDWVDDTLNDFVESKLVDGLRSKMQSLSVNAVSLIESLGGNVTDRHNDNSLLIGHVKPDLRIDQLYSTSSALTLGLSTSLSAHLHRPSWRVGRSYQPMRQSKALSLFDADTTEPFDLHVIMALDVVNSVVSTAWYLFWAIVSDDPAALASSLCQTTPNDPCIFPPILQTIETRTVVFVLIKALFPAFSLFSLEAVMDPPLLSSSTKGEVTGTGSGKLVLVGSNRRRAKIPLAQFDLKLSVDVSIPTFRLDDPIATLWQNFDMPNLNIETLNVTVFHDNLSLRPFGSLRERLRKSAFGWAASVVGKVVDKVMPNVKARVREVLEQQTAQFSLFPSALDNFPVTGFATRILDRNGNNSTRIGLAQLDGGDSVVEVASDVAVKIDSM